MSRPYCEHGMVSTPSMATVVSLLGANVFGPNAISGDEFRAIRKLYGVKREPTNEKPPAPSAPTREEYGDSWKYEDAVRQHGRALEQHAKWADPRELHQAGSDRNAVRHASTDGLRVIAWLAKYVQPGDDPLKLVVQLAAEAGLDVNCEDIEWANGDVGETGVGILGEAVKL